MLRLLQPADFQQHLPNHCVHKSVEEYWGDRVLLGQSSLYYERPSIEYPRLWNHHLLIPKILLELL